MHMIRKLDAEEKPGEYFELEDSEIGTFVEEMLPSIDAKLYRIL